jgi:glycosyltransferase involved in cell wall biosynthesis
MPSPERMARPPPLVSVVMPTFNRLQYLPAAIGSVFEQTLTDWELIIADDGSQQPTREYLHTFSGHPRVTIIWLAHTGVPAAVRNAALRQCAGDYVAFIDSDDIWEARKLERQLQQLRERRVCRWSYTAFTNVDEYGEPLPEEVRRRWLPCEGEIFDRMLRGEVSIRTPSVMAARQLLAESGTFDESMPSAEDYDLWMRLALRSEVALVDEPLVRIRSHRENHSANWSSAYVGQDHTFKKLQACVDQGRRAALRRERARNSLRLASQQ